MRRFLSERYIAGCLFVVAFVVFFLAEQDTRAFQQQQKDSASSVSELQPSRKKTAENNLMTLKAESPVAIIK